MKIKLKNPQALPNAWKSCGMTKEEWKDLEAGKSVEVKTSEWRKFDQKIYISDIHKVCKTLHWSPTVTPAEGVGRMVDWIEENSSIFV